MLFHVPFLGHGGRDPRLSAREEVGSPHLPPKTKLPAFCRAGWVGRKHWSFQHVPPSRPEPKATVHTCTVRALTQDAVSSGYEVLVFARLCPLARAVLFHVPFLGHGGRDPRLSAREEVGSPHLPPAPRSPPRFKTRSSHEILPTRVLNNTRSMPSYMTHSHRRTPRDER